MAPQHAKPILKQLYRYFEVDNLKAVLRSIVSDPDWERVHEVLFPMGSMSVLPAQAMVESGSVGSAIELLQGTPYYETLSFAMKRYSTEQNLFPLEVALDLYPGQIWAGKVEAIWQGSGQGQMLPSGTLPSFTYVPSEVPQGQFAVSITLDDPDQTKFPIGTQGRAAIYTFPDSPFVFMRKITLRSYTWYNWLYPFSG
jgi:hypothetical protein